MLAEIIHSHFGINCYCQESLDKAHVSDGPTPILIEYYINRTGLFPTICGDTIPSTNLTWSMLQRTILRFGDSMRLGIPAEKEHLAMAYYFIHENLISMLSEWVATRGEVPTTESGTIPNTGGLTWADADGYVKG